MNRLWSRVSVRVIAVGLLVLGIVGGVYLGQGRATQQRGAEAQLVVQADADETQLLKARQSQHAAARAWQREAEGNAAAKAAAEAKAAASKAHKLEKKAIEKKLAEKKAAEEAEKKAAEKDDESSSSGGASKPYDGPIPSSCAEFSGNRKIGCAVMIDAGFAIDQFPCLDGLYERESGWNEHAENTGSGAYGIPQALPGDKMASAGSDWQTNPATQVTWGLGYIKDRYGTPCDAKAHSDNSGWY